MTKEEALHLAKDIAIKYRQSEIMLRSAAKDVDLLLRELLKYKLEETDD